MFCGRGFLTLEPLQEKEADENNMSCEDKCFPDCMTNELNECVEACQRLCPAIWPQSAPRPFIDCWKGYINFAKYEHEHKTVTYSAEFVNKDWYETNKIEDQWRQLKVNETRNESKQEHYASLPRNSFGSM